MEYFEVDKLTVHHWVKVKNGAFTFSCDYGDCPHKIQPKETYYMELYSDEQTESFCLECASFFMAQAVNTLLDNWGNTHKEDKE